MPPAIRLGLGVMLSAAAIAQSKLDIAEILTKVSETYKAASQYELAADLKLQERGADAGTRSDNRMRFAFQAPNRYRLEGAIPGMSAGFEEFSEALIVHDGSTVWV